MWYMVLRINIYVVYGAQNKYIYIWYMMLRINIYVFLKYFKSIRFCDEDAECFL